jgi:CRP-like cAMP-binding protein
MKKELIQFLSQFDELNKSEINELARLMTVKEFKKNKLLVKQGQFCNLCYFLLKGCLRQYIVTDGAEKTIAIYTEQQAVNFYTNQGNEKASESFLVSVEDTVVLVGNPEKDQALFSQFPKLVEITRKMMEKDFGEMQNSFAKFITSSPEERYLSLLKERPELLQRVPQTIIASYLGITPESLSRIRKRIQTK